MESDLLCLPEVRLSTRQHPSLAFEDASVCEGEGTEMVPGLLTYTQPQ